MACVSCAPHVKELEKRSRTRCSDDGRETNGEEQDLVDVEHGGHDERQRPREERAEHRGDTVGPVPHGDA
jgi:hypothetical protein